MRSVKMPWSVIVAVVLCLFAAALYGARQYGAFGSAAHVWLAVGAGVGCLALIAGLIYANYESYPAETPRTTGKNHHVNGTCQ